MRSRPRQDSTSDDSPATDPPPDAAGERGGGRRRTYNRRHDDQELSPPYFEAFDRMATALEHIEELLRTRSVTLPDAGNRERVEER